LRIHTLAPFTFPSPDISPIVRLTHSAGRFSPLGPVGIVRLISRDEYVHFLNYTALSGLALVCHVYSISGPARSRIQIMKPLDSLIAPSPTLLDVFVELAHVAPLLSAKHTTGSGARASACQSALFSN
jgi:hypothetical protein